MHFQPLHTEDRSRDLTPTPTPAPTSTPDSDATSLPDIASRHGGRGTGPVAGRGGKKRWLRRAGYAAGDMMFFLAAAGVLAAGALLLR